MRLDVDDTMEKRVGHASLAFLVGDGGGFLVHPHDGPDVLDGITPLEADGVARVGVLAGGMVRGGAAGGACPSSTTKAAHSAQLTSSQET